MKATWNSGMALVLVALLPAAAGCAGSSAVSVKASEGSPSPSSPPASAGSDAPGEAGPVAPSVAPPPGYPGGASAGASQGASRGDAPPPPPPPAPPVAAVPPAQGQPPSAKASRSAEVAPSPEQRPGLGTQWGETRNSHISTVPFVRADASTPFSTTALFYNDEQGARAMASGAGFRRTSSGAFTVAGGILSIGLRDERGTFLTGFVAGEKNYTVGEAGHRYTIVIQNHTDNRIECVLSVDGLDVLDGKAASFGKRGYLVDPRGELEVDGFRQTLETVAAFRFGSVRNSYANEKHGDTRNVGVIGLALFNERGTNPALWNPAEIERRKDANPFPGQFATPPGT